MLLQITNGTLSIGGQTVLSGFDFEIKGKEKIAVVGRNGCGKTTFLRLLAGELELDRDDTHRAGFFTSRKLTIGFLKQNAFSDLSLSVEALLLSACPCPDNWDRERFAWEQEYDRIFTGFGFSKNDKGKQLAEFSGGEQTKIALIHLLLQKPDLLLLDEPTNHLDTETVEWLEEYLRHYEHAVILVSHDRFFLDQTVDTVWEVQNRKMTCYRGNYTEFRKTKQKNNQLQEKAYRRQQEETERLNDLIERFKHKPRKAAFARSRKKLLERMTPVEKPTTDNAHIFTGEIIPDVIPSKWVLEAEHLQIGYDRSLLELTVRIRRGQKIGIIGPNGAGKSTFLKTVAGQLPPLKGKCTLGLNVHSGYFDQQTASFSSEQQVVEHFHERFPAMTEKEVRQTLGAFLFPGKDASKRISQLSGGERARLALCELLTAKPNLLLLDEPTNHMDIPAKETLESAFQAYKGTLLFVSHDRYFISQVAEALLIFEENQVLYYPFCYEHYLERKHRNSSDRNALIRAEEQALISGLQSVPKAERHSLREISTEDAYRDWQLSLALEPLKKAAAALEQHERSFDSEKAWFDPSYAQTFSEQQELLTSAYTEACLNWYDIWNEFHSFI